MWRVPLDRWIGDSFVSYHKIINPWDTLDQQQVRSSLPLLYRSGNGYKEGKWLDKTERSWDWNKRLLTHFSFFYSWAHLRHPVTQEPTCQNISLGYCSGVHYLAYLFQFFFLTRFFLFSLLPFILLLHFPLFSISILSFPFFSIYFCLYLRNASDTHSHFLVVCGAQY